LEIGGGRSCGARQRRRLPQQSMEPLVVLADDCLLDDTLLSLFHCLISLQISTADAWLK
jgi:hypothetical protein